MCGTRLRATFTMRGHGAETRYVLRASRMTVLDAENAGWETHSAKCWCTGGCASGPGPPPSPHMGHVPGGNCRFGLINFTELPFSEGRSSCCRGV